MLLGSPSLIPAVADAAERDPDYARRSRGRQAQREQAATTARLSGQAAEFQAQAAAAAASEAKVQEWSIKVRDELPKLGAAFEETARKARDNRLDEAWDIASLPDKIIVAKDAVVQAQKDLEEARGSVQRAEARLRLRDAQKELLDLEQTLRDAGPGAAAQAAMLGKLIGKGIYDEVVGWNSLTRRDLEALGDVSVNVGVNRSSGPERRAWGGPAEAGVPYIVGERGVPELFVPSQSGTILPKVPTGSSSLAVTINVSGSGDPAAVAREVLQELKREVNRQGMTLSAGTF